MANGVYSWADELQKPIEQVSDLLQPNKKLQREVYEALNDPIKAQTYANMYHANPNAFDPKKYGAGNIERMKAITSDPEFLKKRQVAQAGIDAMKDPNVAASAGANAIGGRTADQLLKEKQEAIQSGVDTEVKKRKNEMGIQMWSVFENADKPTQEAMKRNALFVEWMGGPENVQKINDEKVAAIGRGAKLREMADKYLTENPGDINTLVLRARSKGKDAMSLETMGALMEDERMGAAFKNALDAYDNAEMQKLQTAAAMARTVYERNSINQRVTDMSNSIYLREAAKLFNDINKFSSGRDAKGKRIPLDILESNVVGFQDRLNALRRMKDPNAVAIGVRVKDRTGPNNGIVFVGPDGKELTSEETQRITDQFDPSLMEDPTAVSTTTTTTKKTTEKGPADTPKYTKADLDAALKDGSMSKATYDEMVAALNK